MQKLIYRIIIQISIKNLKLFVLYTKEYGMAYAINLVLSFLLEKGIISNGLYAVLKNSSYKKWILNNEPSKKKLSDQINQICLFKKQPLISILVVTQNPQVYLFVEMIESILNQTYAKWELIIVNDFEINHLEEFQKKYPVLDSRIKFIRTTSNNSNTEMMNLALSFVSGEYVVFINCGDSLAPFALFELIKCINEIQEVDFIYSDEDKISKEDGQRHFPIFKPDWGPSIDMLLSYNYFGRLSVIKRSLFNEIKIGLNNRFAWNSFNEAIEYELNLKIIEQTDKIIHIPKILYHRRILDIRQNCALCPKQKVIQDYMNRQGIDGKVEKINNKGFYKTTYLLKESPLISIMIPTKDKVSVLEKCINSILMKSTYKNYEILIIDNQSHALSTNCYYESLNRNQDIQVITYDKYFNYSAINNFASRLAKGDIYLFLNNDTEVITEDWLEQMLCYIERKDVGAVGPKLLYPNNTIQNAGIVIGVAGLCQEIYKYYKNQYCDNFIDLSITRNVSAVTGACMMVKKLTFELINGFDEELEIAYNDVDLCLKIREKGFLINWTPYAELYHHERLTRGRPWTKDKWTNEIAERKYFSQKWHDVIKKGDPYYNSNFNQKRADFSLP